jgi:acyl-CoA thioester hydrolase
MTACNIAGAFKGGRHVLPVRVYYEDTDFSGVVYHASYLRFMERGRTEYLRLLGIDHRALFEAAQAEGSGFAFAVRAMKIEFLKPAHMDDVLAIHTAPADVRGASMILAQRVLRGEETLVEAQVRVALVCGGRAQRIPSALREALCAHLQD